MLKQNLSVIASEPLLPQLQEAVSDTLEELWISYNNIEKLKGITGLANLRVCVAF